MTFGQFLVGAAVVVAILLGAFTPPRWELFMGLTVGFGLIGCKFVP